jgi:hypothetical protein
MLFKNDVSAVLTRWSGSKIAAAGRKLAPKADDVINEEAEQALEIYLATEEWSAQLKADAAFCPIGAPIPEAHKNHVTKAGTPLKLPASGLMDATLRAKLIAIVVAAEVKASVGGAKAAVKRVKGVASLALEPLGEIWAAVAADKPRE